MKTLLVLEFKNREPADPQSPEILIAAFNEFAKIVGGEVRALDRLEAREAFLSTYGAGPGE